MLAQTGPAQIPSGEPGGEPFTISVTSELVLLDVSVTDAAGNRVTNLKRENFRVYENGRLQGITQFSSEDVPVTAGLVIDTSGSMRGKYGDAMAAALAYIGASNPGDEMFVVNFGDRVSSGLPPDTPFSADLRQLTAALSLGVPAGRTALYDAVLYSLRHLDAGTKDKKVLLLISDGGDNNSVHGYEDAMQAALASRATIYAIGIAGENDPDKNPALLQRLARISGGEAFFPEQISALIGICRQIAVSIRTRYSVGYAPSRAGHQGAFRKLRVTATGADGRRLVVHTRTGYVLPPERDPAAGPGTVR